MSRALRSGIGITVSLAFLSVTPLLYGGGWISLGSADDLAIDQPQVTFKFYQPGTSTYVGPPIPYADLGIVPTAVLDTGANGILLGQDAYNNPGGTDHSPYQPATYLKNGVVTNVTYQEEGVAGSQALTVYQPYDLQVAGGSGLTITLPSVHAFGDPTLDLGGFAAVVGMPSMYGREVQMNLTSILDSSTMGITAGLQLGLPPSNGHRYSVPLTMLPYDYGTQNASVDPKPTYAPLPEINTVTLTRGSANQSGPMLLDTGAQTSIISQATAAALGIDYTHSVSQGGDVIDNLDVGGVGGTTSMPVVMLDHVTLPTAEGVNLVYDNVAVGVLDIPGITGVFGMNMLTNGYLSASFGGTSTADLLNDPTFLAFLIQYGWLPAGSTQADLAALLGQLGDTGSAIPSFDAVNLDFRNASSGSAMMYLDLNPSVDNVMIPEPATFSVLLLGGIALLAGPGRRSVRR